MKVKYLYQLLASHLSILLIAFLILSLLFSHYVENLVFENKVEELTDYGEKILNDLNLGTFYVGERRLNEYSNLLQSRNIEFIVFNYKGEVTYSRKHPEVTITPEEWKQLSEGEIIKLKKDIRRFDQAVSLVALPKRIKGELVGGVLLVSPISGSREMIGHINKYLLYTVGIALSISLLVSFLLAKIHVKRIKRIGEATSMIAEGNYNVQVPEANFDEISDLASDFNRMALRLKTSKEEIESLENRRRQFMADVSHELRTPLTTIRGIMEGLRNNMIEDEQKEKGINLVNTETKRLIRLVNENLDYEKIRSNQVVLTKINIELFEVFEVIKEQLLNQAEENGNEMKLEVDHMIMAYADYDRLIQIIINITKNSIQFTKNGTIWLRGKRVGSTTIIEIEDTGIGMDANEVEWIWRRFYKADISRNSNPYGEFGLGLSIVKQLIHLHDGDIQVESERDKGTKFTISLPVKKG